MIELLICIFITTLFSKYVKNILTRKRTAVTPSFCITHNPFLLPFRSSSVRVSTDDQSLVQKSTFICYVFINKITHLCYIYVYKMLKMARG